MRGKILDFNIQSASGIISADDGNRYNFVSAEWKGDKSPASNLVVDFEINDGNAVAIYLDPSASSVNMDDLKNKFSDIKNSDAVNNIVANGVQYKAGFIVSLLLAFSMFMPIIDAGMFGSASFIDGGFGKVLFLVFLGIAFAYYSGFQKQYIKLAVIVTSVLILFKYYDLISSFAQLMSRGLNLFGLLGFGAYVVFILTVAYLVIGLKTKFND